MAAAAPQDPGMDLAAALAKRRASSARLDDPISDCVRASRRVGRRRGELDGLATWTPVCFRARAALAAALALLVVILPCMQIAAPRGMETAAASAMRFLLPATPAGIQRISEMLECATRVEVVDGTGQFVGWARQDPACPVKPTFRTARVTQDEAKRFARAVEIVEGRHRIGRRTLLGINLPGLARGVVSSVLHLCCDAPVTGGSNGILTGLKNVNGEPGSAPLGRRLALLFETAALTAHLLSTDTGRDMWVTLTLPAARGAGGSRFGPEIAGGLLPRAVFGKARISDLDDAEICILAAALHRQILIVSKDTPITDRIRAAETNDRIRARAVSRCIDPMEADGLLTASQAATARTQILTLRFPMEEKGRTDPDRILPHAMPGAAAFLSEAVEKEDVGPAVVRLDTGLRSDVQTALAAQLSPHLADIETHLADGVCLKNCEVGKREGVLAADVMVAIVELVPDGPDRLVAITQNRGGLFLGPPDGLPVTRSSGSISKLLAVPLLAVLETGRFCRRAWADLHDYGGYPGNDCSDPAGFLDLADLIARSSNLAYAEAIAIADPSRLRTWFESLGLVVADRATEAALRRSLATGENALASPRIIARAVASISSVALGLPARAEAAAAYPGQSNALLFEGNNLTPAADLAHLRNVLSAPLAARRGTLRALRTRLIDLGCRPQSLFGKSGTSDAADPSGTGVRDKLVVIHATCGGRRFVVSALVGSPRIDRALGRVPTERVGRLAIAALKTVIEAKGERR